MIMITHFTAVLGKQLPTNIENFIADFHCLPCTSVQLPTKSLTSTDAMLSTKLLPKFHTNCNIKNISTEYDIK